MKIKLLGLVWNLKPIVVFAWLCVLIFSCVMCLSAMLKDNLLGVLCWFGGCMLWIYVSATLEANGYISNRDEKAAGPSKPQ